MLEMMSSNISKIIAIAVLLIIITTLNFLTQQNHSYHQIILRELYFLPIFLAVFWFGIKEGLITSLLTSAIYITFIYKHWQNFSPDDFTKILELILYNSVAIALGILKHRGLEQQPKKQGHALALTGPGTYRQDIPIFNTVSDKSKLIFEENKTNYELFRELQNTIDRWPSGR
jgi:thiamine transporter ThiT